MREKFHAHILLKKVAELIQLAEDFRKVSFDKIVIGQNPTPASAFVC